MIRGMKMESLAGWHYSETVYYGDDDQELTAHFNVGGGGGDGWNEPRYEPSLEDVIFLNEFGEDVTDAMTESERDSYNDELMQSAEYSHQQDEDDRRAEKYEDSAYDFDDDGY